MSAQLKFWGVRGSRPVINEKTRRYGGNTSCLQLVIGDLCLIFDGGTGLAELGQSTPADYWHRRGGDDGQRTHLFFSHQHWDHIQGIPFFAPFYDEKNDFHLYGATRMGFSFEELISRQMQPPYFPITMKAMQSQMHYTCLEPDLKLTLPGGITVRTFALNHPNGCLAYRVDLKDASFVYATDTEPLFGAHAQRFLKFVSGASVLVYDAHFTDEEYYHPKDGISRKGWGHSTWQEGVRISRLAGVGQLVLFHHLETREDEAMFNLEQAAARELPGTIAAKEGLSLELGGSRL